MPRLQRPGRDAEASHQGRRPGRGPGNLPFEEGGTEAQARLYPARPHALRGDEDVQYATPQARSAVRQVPGESHQERARCPSLRSGEAVAADSTSAPPPAGHPRARAPAAEIAP